MTHRGLVPHIASLALVAFLAGCASAPPEATPTASRKDLLGTWRLDSMTDGAGKEHEARDPAFFQFYPDGSVASWSAADEGEVSQGRYAVREGRLILPDTPSGAAGDTFGVTAGTWWYEKEKGERYFYHRVRPDPLPGDLP